MHKLYRLRYPDVAKAKGTGKATIINRKNMTTIITIAHNTEKGQKTHARINAH